MKHAKISTAISAVALLMTVAACDKETEKKPATQTAQKATPTDSEATPPAPAPEPTDGLDPRVIKAAHAANQIVANPGNADAILQEANLDREQFDAMIYEIAADPELREQYRIALGTHEGLQGG